MVDYSKLMRLLNEKSISKTKLAKDVGISRDTLSKLTKNEPVRLEIIEKICRYLNVIASEIIEFVDEEKNNPLLEVLIDEKNSNYKGGIYHETQILLTYNSNHIEGSTLSEDQTRYIFETSTILFEKEQGILVDDVIETINHFNCIKFILDHVYDELNEDLIKELHKILKTGTKDAGLAWFNVGEYKLRSNVVGGRKTIPPSLVKSKIIVLLNKYSNIFKPTFEDIVDFHYEFECIHPFQDGNGRVGRLIAFKECLKYGYIPFVIDERLKAFYYRGLKEYSQEKGYLLDTCRSGQDRYKLLLDYFKIEY